MNLHLSEFAVICFLGGAQSHFCLCTRFIDRATLSKADVWKGAKEALPVTSKTRSARASPSSQAQLKPANIKPGKRGAKGKRAIDEDGDPDDDDPADKDFVVDDMPPKVPKRARLGGLTPRTRRFIENTYMDVEAVEDGSG